MATTTGLVQQITWSASTVCVTVGASPSSAELLFIQFSSSDTEAVLGFKKSLANLLARAKMAGYQVLVTHPDDSAEIGSVTFGEFNICPVGHAVHNDFYSVTASAIPTDAQLVFDSVGMTVTVAPDLVRPHWVFVNELPAVIPVGRNLVRLEAPGWTSDSVPVDVSSGPPVRARVLYTGAPKDRPYTIAFVANPAIETVAGSFVADSVLTNRAGFQDVVGYCLRNLLTVTEDLVTQGDRDRQMRFFAIFDPSLGVSDSNALAIEGDLNLMLTRRTKLKAFLARYSEAADMVFVIHGSTTYDRATAWYTTDDPSKAGTAYTYDGAGQTHGHFPLIPGSAALPLNLNQTGLTPLHEFGHGASDFNNGKVWDLYVDSPGGGFVVNQKFRALNTDPIPASFANYNGTDFGADPNRDGLGYPAAWTSYHPVLADSTRPNLMDNYWLAFDDPQRCRLDQLTYAWLTDRLGAKLTR